ncbi:MAG: hypothetical protein B6D44_10240 [Ignavibacteriales bacterium UTCHB2]|jgi:hypothetical protein|nr:MAG: hypothetical protein B6D44_10240 [Ignavibacteriales bacterium UTCHB2]
MYELTTSIFIGVFSGIITAIIIWLFVQLFNKLLIPWYQQYIYRGINLTGHWERNIEYTGQIILKQSIALQQKGHNLIGSLISSTKFPNNIEETASYLLSGEVFDNYVDIEYQITDKSKIGRGSILLKVKIGGDVLEGCQVSIDRRTTDIILSDNVTWTRKK